MATRLESFTDNDFHGNADMLLIVEKVSVLVHLEHPEFPRLKDESLEGFQVQTMDRKKRFCTSDKGTRSDKGARRG